MSLPKMTTLSIFTEDLEANPKLKSSKEVRNIITSVNIKKYDYTDIYKHKDKLMITKSLRVPEGVHEQLKEISKITYIPLKVLTAHIIHNEVNKQDHKEVV